MLDVLLLKEGLQIEQRSTILVELLGIRPRPPDDGDRRCVAVVHRPSCATGVDWNATSLQVPPCFTYTNVAR